MKAAIVGATGFIGVPLCHSLKQDGWKITVLARNVDSAEKALGPGYNIIGWTSEMGIPEGTLEDVDIVINLAGESIGKGRWTKERKKQIFDSRINTTRKLIDVIKRLDKKPTTLINASAAGYYGPRDDEALCESEEAGDGFLAGVCKAWEEEALKAKRFHLRVVPIRIGVVLGNGGALKRMVIPFKLFAGGNIGSGKQWLSWIHRDDLIGIIKYVAGNQSINSPVNATSPKPVTMKEFTKTLGQVLHRPSWLPIPSAFLKMGLGEAADMVLKGQRVLPCKLIEAGYEFKFESLADALTDALGMQYTREIARSATPNIVEITTAQGKITKAKNNKKIRSSKSTSPNKENKGKSNKSNLNKANKKHATKVAAKVKTNTEAKTAKTDIPVSNLSKSSKSNKPNKSKKTGAKKTHGGKRPNPS